MQTTILAKSSSGEPYNVTFSILEGRMTVRCSCKAGLLNQQCKHKRELVSGGREMLFDQNQAELLRRISASTECQSLAGKLALKEAELAELEREKGKIASKEKAIKHDIGVLFARGEN